jgi:hypothetical protein
MDASGATAVRVGGKIVWERFDGLGDLVASILRHTRVDKLIKNWIQWRYGKTCGCAKRQEWLNWLVPFHWPTWKRRFALLFPKRNAVG